ncbi:D-arabinose 5-phosphate isomerase [Bacteroidia bacterium]|nr:D-arabinose 5-phosphate isomerase [Bacteroidia bacterium]
MKNFQDILNIARRTIQNEASAIKELEGFIDDEFAEIVQKILAMKGRLIISGIGKSATIGLKIVSTLNSTGTPAVFMHAADAIHGDLGIIQEHDIVMCISKSGNTPEIKVLVPLIKQFGNTLIGMVGDTSSFLAEQADYIINCSVKRETCPNNLAPTTSTTAQLVMGDALSIALLECRGFTAADFAKYHPGGTLGKRLYLRVADLVVHNEKPMVAPDSPIQDVIVEMTAKRLGATAVIDNGKIVGIITDGDLRRVIHQNRFSQTLVAADIMGKSPKTIHDIEMAVNALEQIRTHHITQLLVVDNNDQYAGIVHLHDLLREGIL